MGCRARVRGGGVEYDLCAALPLRDILAKRRNGERRSEFIVVEELKTYRLGSLGCAWFISLSWIRSFRVAVGVASGQTVRGHVILSLHWNSVSDLTGTGPEQNKSTHSGNLFSRNALLNILSITAITARSTP